MSAREVIARARCMRRFDRPICETLCEDCLYWADNDLAALSAAGLAVVPVDADAQRQADLKLLAAHFGGPDAWKREAARLAAWGRAHLPVEIYEFVGTTADGVLAMHRAALRLEAAAMSFCNQDGECPCATPADCVMLSRRDYIGMARAIAAFLRTLPQASVMIATTVDGSNQWHTTRTLAAAVEEAARHDR